MRSSEPLRVGLIGSGWITRVHLQAIRAGDQAVVVACADYPRDRGGRAGRGEALAGELGVPRYYPDYRQLLANREVEAVTVALPNALHAEVCLAALEAGKHALVEKPLCIRLEEAERIVRVAQERGLVVGYAEELCYCPKLVRGRELVRSGAIGRLFWLKHVEAHEGPYAEWFFDPLLGGGGAAMDLGCHSIEYARWMFDKAPVRRVTARMARHAHLTRQVEDHCVVHLELEDGRAALIEAGWSLQGGMDSVAHLQGSQGALKIDLLKHSGLSLFSTHGERALDVPPGWSVPPVEWLRDNGYPQEMSDFARAVREGRAMEESAEDGRAVLEILWAAYASAASGRTVSLPYRPPMGVDTPVQMWMDRPPEP